MASDTGAVVLGFAGLSLEVEVEGAGGELLSVLAFFFFLSRPNASKVSNLAYGRGKALTSHNGAFYVVFDHLTLLKVLSIIESCTFDTCTKYRVPVFVEVLAAAGVEAELFLQHFQFGFPCFRFCLFTLWFSLQVSR